MSLLGRTTDSLECKVERCHDEDRDGAEDEDADLLRGDKSTAAPELVVAGETLVLSLSHDLLVLQHQVKGGG